MPRYDSDTEIAFNFDITFYAANATDADNIAANTLNRLFGSAVAGLMDRVNTSNVALVGQDIVGANYTYTYEYNFRMGDKDAMTPIYNTLFAATAADALSQLQANTQRITNVISFPLKVNYLKQAP